ncbi:hypothetical protein KK060_19895 [Fulvivirgaceae bacterium PWU20]|uniref:Secretion protein n=2 Tax=Chryseosolibacter indicus TaxID=2782351 RepID=A0ABS5VWX5_9BACT|nr:hypothetical protein [Chryseosolibacter indicus]
MKTLLKIVVLCVLTVLLTLAAKAKGKDPESGDKSKNSLYVLKTDKRFIGAQVEIIQPNGDVISKQILQKRKMIIAFDEARLGAYIIRVSKDGKTREYKYEKK